MKEAVIVSGVRTAGGRAPRGTLRDTRPEFLGKVCMEEAMNRLGTAFSAEMIDDVIWGCATPEQVCGLNTARITALYAGIPDSVSAVTINRFCASGLQAEAFGAEAIMCGRCDIVMAGGIEHMSLIPMGGVIRPDPAIAADPVLNKIYTGMGQTAENVARRYGIGREEQDQFALASHQKAAAASREGRFKNEIVPVPVSMTTLGKDGKPVTRESIYDADEGIRYDITLEQLASLRAAFVAGGTVTAGNSSQTTDGASAVVMMSAERARELGLQPIVKFRGMAVHGCAPDEMGIGPALAIPKVLKMLGLGLKDIGLIELNEAFAAQSLYCIRELGLDPGIVNVNGGAIALGHPMGSTGCKLTVTLMNEMQRRQVKYGIVSMCIGGGMGGAGVFELC